LEQQPSAYQAGDFFQGVQVVAQVIQHTHKHNDVKLLAADDTVNLVDVALHELDIQPTLVAGEPGLGQV
jgi:ribonuclease HIII